MSENRINIRQMTENDFDLARQLWAETGLNISSSDTNHELSIMIKNNPDLCLIGEIITADDKDYHIIATALGSFDGRRGWIYHFAILSRYQRQHFGKLMMEELIQRFRAKNVIKIMLLVHNDNINAINFYKKVGWNTRQDLDVMSFILRE